MTESQPSTLGPKTTSPKPFYQWSEVHGVTPQDPTRRADVALHSASFKISGPPDLIIATQVLAQITQDQYQDDTKWAIFTQVWCNWHVICSVSGDKILLCDLRYWNAEKNLIFRDPTLISGSAKGSHAEGESTNEPVEPSSQDTK